ncbi:MAG TPA: methyltransferase [Jatrophihabitans sp.]|nr:methyltransferase [Jatrophihabitans sp.]
MSVQPLFPAAVLDQLGQAVRDRFSSVAVTEVLGLPGEAALSRGDLSGADRLTRQGSATETLIRLFVLGLPVPAAAARAALRPLPLAEAEAAGLLEQADGQLRARLDLRPYSETGGPDWWVFSDLGAEVRPGPLHPEHVLGIGSAGLTLAEATVRGPVRRALDVGIGCGVQALHLSEHSAAVTGTDVSARALGMAATTAALNAKHWQLRQGSLLEPVGQQRFDLIVSNPPFIVGPGFHPGSGGFRYRDSGLPGDSVCAELVRGLPDRLTEGGTGQLLANWIIDGSRSWQERVSGWLPATGCRAWVWQREVAEPGEYVALWLRDAGEQPGTAGWRQRYDGWLDWFAATGVAGIGMGLINVRRTPEQDSRVVCQDVRQPHEHPIGPAIEDWFGRAAWLHGRSAAQLLDARLVAAPGMVCSTHSLITADGWQPALVQLRQAGGLRWELEVDDAVAALVAACTGEATLGVVLSVLAAAVSADADAVTTALIPVVLDLIERGFLVPVDLASSAGEHR